MNIKFKNQAITLTFGDVAENHVGMQKIGTESTKGFTLDDLLKTKKWFNDKGSRTKLINLHDYLDENEQSESDEAYLLIIKNAVNTMMGDNNGADLLYKEQETLKKDTKAFMYGRVVNKHARYNLCFGEKSQKPDYENKKGRIVAFDDVPNLDYIRTKLAKCIGPAGANLQVEGNYYYDVTKTGIGFHGDSERKKVCGVRLGTTIPLHFVWYKNNIPVSPQIVIKFINHGDMYIMSEKTTGFDWKKKKIYTLRHAAGSKKYTTIDV